MHDTAPVTIPGPAGMDARPPVRARPGAGLLPLAVILIAPFVGVLALRAPLVNAIQYRDPWFYSGYGWSLAHDVEIFGWFYYAVRFPVTLPIGWSASLFGAVGGYLVLHYLILAATGGALYACVRRFADRWIACAAVLLLALSPFYMRMVLWDYTSFVCLPASIAAAAVWHLGGTARRRLWSAVGAGALVGVAMFANPIAWMLIPALYGVEGIGALRSGAAAVRHFLVRVGVSVLGAVAVFVLGYLGYRTYLGGNVAPRDLIEPTLSFAREGSAHVTPFQIPARTWLEHEPRVYGPPLVCLATIIVLGRSLLANTTAARVAQFAVAYTAIVWLYRKAIPTAIIETWWAYNLTAITPCFALPVVLHQLSTGAGRKRAAIVAAVAATAIAGLAIRGFNRDAVRVYDEVRTHLWLLALLLLVVLAAAIATRLGRGAYRTAALALMCAGVMFFSLAPAGYLGVQSTGEFSPIGGKAELASYGAAHDLTKLLELIDQPTGRVMLWSTLIGYSDLGWVNLPHQQGGIDNPEAPTPVGTLTPSELALLRYPTTRGVLVLSDVAADVPAAVAALRKNGLQPDVRRQGSWGGGRVFYALIYTRPRT